MTQQAAAVLTENTSAVTSNAPLAPLGDLPGIPAGPTDAEKAAQVEKELAERQLKESNALARFDTTIGFKLEGQIVGQCSKRAVSKAGGVRVGLKSKKEMSVISGKKGLELDAFTRMRGDELKEKESVLAARLAGDNNWTGAGYTLSAKGDKITLEYKKVAPMTVSVNEPSDEAIAKALGKTVEQVKAMKQEAVNEAAAKAKYEAEVRAKVEQAIADEKAAKELAEEEEAIAKSAANNGHVGAPDTKSDNDTE